MPPSSRAHRSRSLKENMNHSVRRHKRTLRKRMESQNGSVGRPRWSKRPRAESFDATSGHGDAFILIEAMFNNQIVPTNSVPARAGGERKVPLACALSAIARSVWSTSAQRMNDTRMADVTKANYFGEINSKFRRRVEWLEERPKMRRAVPPLRNFKRPIWE